MPHILGGSRVEKEIASELRWNFKQWPRLEAAKAARPCDEYFYTAILTDERLDQLSKITGRVYPHWGDQVGNYYIGKDSHGTYVPVGMRWTESYEEWLINHKAASVGGRNEPSELPQNGKRVRHVHGNV